MDIFRRGQHRDCLTLGALGWGQIQVRKGQVLMIEEHVNRQAWMLTLCEKVLAFYRKETVKIQKRQRHFESVRERWQE